MTAAGLIALVLSATLQQPAPQPAPLKLHDQTQKILQYEQELLKVADAEHRADGDAGFEIAMQLSRVAAEAGDDVSVMIDLLSIEQRLACAPDRAGVAPTVTARLSYTVRRLDLLKRSVHSHLALTRHEAIATSGAGLAAALGESRAILAGLLGTR